MSDWFARPVLFVTDVDRTMNFYVKSLGFTEAWRYAEEGETLVAQADRGSCALIFSSQWPHKIGTGMIFVSLGKTVLVDALRAELEERGVTVDNVEWGYPCLLVRDPDGNELYFNYPEAREE